MTTYYKAVRPDGMDFFSGTVRWLPPVGDPMPGGGVVVTHPTSRTRTDGGADGYLSVATVATECTGMRWPCRLAVVEPTRAAVWTPDPGTLPSKRASWQWRVVAEIDAHQALGPQGPEVVAIIDRARMLTADELRQFVERFEQLESEKKDVTEQQKELMAEAKGRGYDTKVLKKVISLRKRKPDDIAEEEAILEVYKQALGME